MHPHGDRVVRRAGTVILLASVSTFAHGQDAGTTTDKGGTNATEGTWATLVSRARWKTDDEVAQLFEDVFGDCELPPEDDLDAVWRAQEIRECRRKQTALALKVRGQVLVATAEVSVVAIDESKRTATLGLRGWSCVSIQRVDPSRRRTPNATSPLPSRRTGSATPMKDQTATFD
jgi:hypothetical protein